MKYLYDIKNKIIKRMKNGATEIELTPLESRLLEILSNGKCNTWEEVIKYVYEYNYSDPLFNWDYKYLYNSVIKIKYNLTKKIRLNIRSIPGVGYELKDQIYIV